MLGIGRRRFLTGLGVSAAGLLTQPTFDVDSVYGGGPSVSAHLYESADRAKFRVESGGLFLLAHNPA